MRAIFPIAHELRIAAHVLELLAGDRGEDERVRRVAGDAAAELRRLITAAAWGEIA